MRIIFAVATLLSLSMTPGYAQVSLGGGGKEKNPLAEQYERDQKERARVEQEYNDTMKRLRTRGPSVQNDPWKSVRPAENSKR